MTQEDLPRVRDIETLCFPPSLHWNISLKELTSASLRFCVARQSGVSSVVGYGSVWLAPDEAHITTLAVDPMFRRQGIGRRLLLHLIEDVRRLGMVSATLEVERGNLAAQALYASLGFISKGIRPHYYLGSGEDAVILWADDLWSETIGRALRER